MAHYKKRIPDKSSQKDFYYFNTFIPDSLPGIDFWYGLYSRSKQAESQSSRN